VVAEHDGDGSFRPDAVLTLFLRMRTKESPNHWEMYADRRVIALLWEFAVAGANGRVRFLTGSS